jgi:phosphoenolpyruvate synthase/pyruvate phosphate dikinase
MNSPKLHSRLNVENERMLDHRALQRLVQAMLSRFRELAGAPFPQSSIDQLEQATNAVFRSWDAPKAAEYRRLNHIPDDIGTAVTVQTMVLGNAGGTSGAGVGFTAIPQPEKTTSILISSSTARERTWSPAGWPFAIRIDFSRRCWRPGIA